MLIPVDEIPPITFVEGKGVRLTAASGARYLDFGAGLGVNLLGYGNPALVHAIQQQASRLVHIGSELMSDTSREFAERLLALTGCERLFLCNSGAEANEAALKLARNYFHATNQPERTGIVAVRGSFHGRTMATISMSGNARHCLGFGPLLPGMTQINPEPEALCCAVDDTTAAIILETIRSRDDVQILSQEMIDTINRLRSEREILVIVDEVQTGWFRCDGALDHHGTGLVADIVTLGKGLAGGLPVGATLTSARIGDRMGLSSHGTTFGGGPLTCAAALATWHELMREQVEIRVRDAHDLFTQLLGATYGREATSGRGLLIGLSLPQVLHGGSADVARRAMELGLIVRTSGANAIRLTPPLLVDSAEIEEGLQILARAIEDISVAGGNSDTGGGLHSSNETPGCRTHRLDGVVA